MSLAAQAAAPVGRTSLFDVTGLDAAITRAMSALLEEQRADGHYAFDLEADAAIPAEYIMVKHFLGEVEPEMERRTANYLRRIQESHGGWPMLAKGQLNMSASVKAYFALKIAGDPVDAPHMVKARNAILAHGGAVNMNIFTRMMLAFFGIVPWSAVPVMPVELMHAPGWFPINIWRFSYWARDTVVPLLVLMAKKPRAANPRRVGIDELFIVPPHAVKRWPKTVNQVGFWGAFFVGLDKVLRVTEPLFPKKSRDSAIQKAVEFLRERLNGEDGVGAIYPSIAYTVMMFHVLGVPEDHPDMIIAKKALEKLVAHNGDEAFCQPCLSPVWDTVLTAHALLEAAPDDTASAERALDWLLPLQVLDVKGDWAYRRPDLRPGGWAFQYKNDHYVDLDDTAVVVMAMDRARNKTGTRRFDHAIDRAVEWVVGMQSTNGGWGAFDVDNTSYYLNHIPFADHGALLDPPTADVTARCLSMLGQLGETAKTSEAVRRGVDYLLREQHPEGSWFGRWGINYIYGTWSVLCAFNAVGIDAGHPAVRRAVDWLIAIQNPDGGWGEADAGYALDYVAYKPSETTASQTAWAVIGLMAAGEVDHPVVKRGIAYLEQNQGEDGFWQEPHYTGTGFPRVFYLRYLGYAKFFPLWALARYRSLKQGNTAAVLHGM
ncbi:squalene--hopene cyclase [Lichenibacterium ramalinae]|uniref:Squalene--hopene cyclase n=1 Tax=Lichenibacterium ramalinae TaxID=2316527 RepID=A0A4Q2RGB2_9HYPH|nr:squalene--hopene cyclase [Lichenibacterium ramalinae]RYB07257.1 squalene--hopene cyclase [Lichenibacterium ramalinae]